MTEINIYKKRLSDFVVNYDQELPTTILGPNKERQANWMDLVWYFQCPATKMLHRYLFFKAHRHKKRLASDSSYQNRKELNSELLNEEHEKLLKIYAIFVQGHSVSNDTKQFRCVCAAQILTIAEACGCLNSVPSESWSQYQQSKTFFDFCKAHKLISTASFRKFLEKRDRTAEGFIQRQSETFKMVSEQKILALGEIFTKIFEDVSDDGHLKKDGNINISEAIPISFALLGLAAPNRMQAEFTLIPNQTLKRLKPKVGESVHYLDWKGSKGFSDNQNHILSALAPFVKKAINFFHYHFKPERHYVRYLKDQNLSWEKILSGFYLEAGRKRNIDFNKAPNVFTVAYALGFYPVNYEVEVLKAPNAAVIVGNRKGASWNHRWDPKLGRKLERRDWVIRKSIGRVSADDLVQNTFNVGNASSDCSILNAKTKTKWLVEALPKRITVTIAELEALVIGHQRTLIPTFPLSYGKTETGIELESALFCCSPNKHGFNQAPYMAGSPLFISPITRVSNLVYNAFKLDNSDGNNLFAKYGFGVQNLKLHSMRHFTNTWADKGGIPLAIIAAWSGRVSINQTLEYVHTTEEDKAERVISTLELEPDHKDIRVISKTNLENEGGLPATLSDTGLCVQELSVTPCNYINDFLSGCFGCDAACYICGDQDAIQMLEKDHSFQTVRLKRLRSENRFQSDARKEWWLNHSVGVALLGQLINILKSGNAGEVVRISSDKKSFFLTNPETRAIEKIATNLPSNKDFLAQLDGSVPNPETHDNVPDGMKEILTSYGIGPAQ